jgi:hypothetical protein
MLHGANAAAAVNVNTTQLNSNSIRICAMAGPGNTDLENILSGIVWTEISSIYIL